MQQHQHSAAARAAARRRRRSVAAWADTWRIEMKCAFPSLRCLRVAVLVNFSLHLFSLPCGVLLQTKLMQSLTYYISVITT